MFNFSGSEIVFLLLLALIVLGPEKLPEAVRKFGKTYAEFKKVTSGFQTELKSALDEPMREMRETADALRKAATFDIDPDAPDSPAAAKAKTTWANVMDSLTPKADDTASTAAAAGAAGTDGVEVAATDTPVSVEGPATDSSPVAVEGPPVDDDHSMPPASDHRDEGTASA